MTEAAPLVGLADEGSSCPATADVVGCGRGRRAVAVGDTVADGPAVAVLAMVALAIAVAVAGVMDGWTVAALPGNGVEVLRAGRVVTAAVPVGRAVAVPITVAVVVAVGEPVGIAVPMPGKVVVAVASIAVADGRTVSVLVGRVVEVARAGRVGVGAGPVGRSVAVAMAGTAVGSPGRGVEVDAVWVGWVVAGTRGVAVAGA